MKVKTSKIKNVKSKKNRFALIPTEEEEQIIFVEWLKYHHIFFYHSPNGGYRRFSEAKRFKKMGVIAGIPDICIPMPKLPFHGMYIELKRRKGGVCSEAQKWCLQELSRLGYATFVAHGADNAIKAVQDYFNGRL